MENPDNEDLIIQIEDYFFPLSSHVLFTHVLTMCFYLLMTL